MLIGVAVLALLTLAGVTGSRVVAHNARRNLIVKRILHPNNASPGQATQPIRVRRVSTSENIALNWLGREIYRAGLEVPVWLGAATLVLIATCAGTALFFAGASVAWMGAGSALAIICALLSLSFFAARRIRTLEDQLADTLDGLTGALQSGMGLRQALDMARRNRRGPISVTFGEILALADYGLPLGDAFRQTARALRSRHFSSFAIAVATSYEGGGSLTPMMQGLAGRIRDGIRLRRRVNSLTAEARFSAVVLIIMPYALGLFIWTQSPESIAFLFKNATGRELAEYALVLQVIGAVWMFRLLRSKE